MQFPLKTLRTCLGLLVVLVAVLVFSEGPASAADVVPPNACDVQVSGSTVGVTIRDSNLDRTRWAIKATNVAGEPYNFEFLGRVTQDGPRTARSTQQFVFETSLSEGAWLISVRGFDEEDNKSDWNGCETISITGEPQLDVSCWAAKPVVAQTRTISMTFIQPVVPADVSFQIRLTSVIYGRELDAGTYSFATEREAEFDLNLPLPSGARPGTWKVDARAALPNGEVGDWTNCGEAKIPREFPAWGCVAGRTDDVITVLIGHDGIPDGLRFAVNLERGVRPTEDYVYIGRFAEGADYLTTVEFDRGIVGTDDQGWRILARWIAPDGTKSSRIDCGPLQ